MISLTAPDLVKFGVLHSFRLRTLRGTAAGGSPNTLGA